MSKSENPSSGLIIDQTQSFSDLWEALHERLIKIEGILISLIGEEGNYFMKLAEMESGIMENVLWTAHSLASEAEAFSHPLWDKYHEDKKEKETAKKAAKK